MSDRVGSTEASLRPYPRERRRFPRVAVSGISVRVPLVVEAEVIDIGLTGALVRCRCPLRVGDRAQLRIVFGRQSVVATMTVVRVVSDWNPERGTTEVGVALVDRDVDSAYVLRQFLTQSMMRSRAEDASRDRNGRA